MTEKRPAKSVPKCPICAKPRAIEYRPFCSKRCANVDLGRWMSGSYAIPTDEVADPGTAPDPGGEH